MTLLKNHTINLGHKTNLIKLHCVIHQEALCARTTNLQRVINTAVNLILFKELYLKQFQKVLVKAENQLRNLFYEVR